MKKLPLNTSGELFYAVPIVIYGTTIFFSFAMWLSCKAPSIPLEINGLASVGAAIVFLLLPLMIMRIVFGIRIQLEVRKVEFDIE